MKYLGSKTLETKRLILRKTEEQDLKVLWEILLKKEVSKYYLTSKINKNWEEEKKWQYKKLDRAGDPHTFIWTLVRKEDHKILGQISFKEKENESKDIGWFLDIPYQRQGYMKEAAEEVLKYMFLEAGISSINTSAAIENPSSWKLMESLGFQDQKKTRKEKYTLLEEEVDCKEYICTKDDFLERKGE